MTIALTPELAQMVKQRMASGAYANEGELILEAIHALDDVCTRHEQLRSEIRERISRAGQGLALPLDLAAFQAEARQRLANET